MDKNQRCVFVSVTLVLAISKAMSYIQRIVNKSKRNKAVKTRRTPCREKDAKWFILYCSFRSLLEFT